MCTHWVILVRIVLSAQNCHRWVALAKRWQPLETQQHVCWERFKRSTMCLSLVSLVAFHITLISRNTFGLVTSSFLMSIRIVCSMGKNWINKNSCFLSHSLAFQSIFCMEMETLAQTELNDIISIWWNFVQNYEIKMIFIHFSEIQMKNRAFISAMAVMSLELVATIRWMHVYRKFPRIWFTHQRESGHGKRISGKDSNIYK